MLIFGALFRCLDKVLTIAASLSCKSPFVASLANGDAAVIKARHASYVSSDSDFDTYCNVWEAYCDALSKEGPSGARKFCNSNYVSMQAMREIGDSRRQYLDLLSSIGFVDRTKITRSTVARSLYNEHGNNVEMLNAVVCAGLYPNIARWTPTKMGASGHGYEMIHKTERLYFHHTSVNASKAATAAATKKYHNTPGGALHHLCFHEKFGTGQNRVSVSTTCPAHPYALILFGGLIQVKHVERRVLVDDWIELSMAAQIGVMLKELRKELDSVLLTQLAISTTNKTKPNIDKYKAQETADLMVEEIVNLLSASS
jgi:Oligonucleotide/oligosaccharide-binding (OB)-fold/Helicase associated domain (HA2)